MSRPSAELDQARPLRTPRRPLAVIEQTAESQPPTDPALETARGPDAFDQLIPLPLMIALAMIVTDKFRDRVSYLKLFFVSSGYQRPGFSGGGS